MVSREIDHGRSVEKKEPSKHRTPTHMTLNFLQIICKSHVLSDISIQISRNAKGRTKKKRDYVRETKPRHLLIKGEKSVEL